MLAGFDLVASVKGETLTAPVGGKGMFSKTRGSMGCLRR
jgi:hypothetical protein